MRWVRTRTDEINSFEQSTWLRVSCKSHTYQTANIHIYIYISHCICIDTIEYILHRCISTPNNKRKPTILTDVDFQMKLVLVFALRTYSKSWKCLQGCEKCVTGRGPGTYLYIYIYTYIYTYAYKYIYIYIYIHMFLRDIHMRDVPCCQTQSTSASTIDGG